MVLSFPLLIINEVWLIRTERQRQQRLAEQITEARVTKVGLISRL